MTLAIHYAPAFTTMSKTMRIRTMSSIGSSLADGVVVFYPSLDVLGKLFGLKFFVRRSDKPRRDKGETEETRSQT
jgi:hypothetical protein